MPTGLFGPYSAPNIWQQRASGQPGLISPRRTLISSGSSSRTEGAQGATQPGQSVGLSGKQAGLGIPLSDIVRNLMMAE